MFDPTSRTRRVRAAHRRGAVASGEIDRILDKIRQRGLHSLTDAERHVLHHLLGEIAAQAVVKPTSFSDG